MKRDFILILKTNGYESEQYTFKTIQDRTDAIDQWLAEQAVNATIVSTKYSQMAHGYCLRLDLTVNYN